MKTAPLAHSFSFFRGMLLDRSAISGGKRSKNRPLVRHRRPVGAVGRHLRHVGFLGNHLIWKDYRSEC